jgi:hypothetical protein
MEKRRLRESILDQIESKDLTAKDVVNATGIPEQYLDAILNDQRNRLPAFPYIRVYLVKVAEVLGLDPNEVILEYKTEFTSLISGSADTLPGNRFALPSSKKKYLIIGGIVGILLIGFILKNVGFFSQPRLVLIMPPIDSRDPFIVESSTIMLSGKIESGDKLTINNQITPVEFDGTFTMRYDLDPELNHIEFRVSRFLGEDLLVTKKVFYREPAEIQKVKIKPSVESTETVSTTESIVE